jgi:hypothetical protein
MGALYRLARGKFIPVLLFTATIIVAPQVHRKTAGKDLQAEYRHVAAWQGVRKVAQYCVPRNNVEDSQRIYCKQKQNVYDVTLT